MLENQIRVPDVSNLGIGYEYGLLNILLMKMTPGSEESVKAKFKNYLATHKNHIISTRRQYKESIGKNLNSEDLSYTCKFGRVMGSFSLAAFFISKGFGISNELCGLKHVESQQFIIGAIPSLNSEYQGMFQVLDQSSAFFVTDDTPEDIEKPIMAICQFQHNGILKTSSGGVLLLPVMKAVDDILCDINASIDCDTSLPLQATIIDGFNWSDVCVIIRSNNFNLVADAVNQIRSLTLKDIYDSWAKLDITEEDEVIHISRHSYNRINRMINPLINIAGRGNNLPSYYDANVSPNHIFSHSMTFLSLLDTAFSRIMSTDGKEKESDLNLSGDIFAYTRLNIRPGYSSKVNNLLKQASSNPEFSDILHLSEPKILFGKADFLISWHTNSGRPEKSPCKAQKCLQAIFNLKNMLELNESDIGIKSNYVTSFSTEIEPVYKENWIEHDEKEILPIDQLYQDFIHSLDLLDFNLLKEKLKRRQVSRNLRLKLVTVLKSWREQLIDYSLSNQMIELADIFIPWQKMLNEIFRNKNASINDLEHTIKFFLGPLEKSINQRFLSSSHMTETHDLLSEFKGGLSKLFVGLDGLSKSCLSLISETNYIGSISLVGKESSAHVNILTKVKGIPGQEYNIAVTHINRNHIVYPYMITTYLHEILHILTQTNDFKFAVKDCRDADILLDILNEENALFSKSQINKISLIRENSLINHRIKEITAEYLLGLLVFNDTPDLYAKVYLSKCVVQSDLYGEFPDKEKMKKVEIEHILRAFCVYAMLTTNQSNSHIQKTDLNEFAAIISQDFEPWWHSKAKYFLSLEDDVDEYERTLLKILNGRSWLNNKRMLIAMKTIMHASNKYFGIIPFEQITLKTESKNYEVRKDFYHKLLKIMTDRLDDVTNLFQKDDTAMSTPIHLFFTAGAQDQKTRDLRTRRLESFIGYILIIRAFHRIIDSWISQSCCESLIIQRDPESGMIVFDPNQPYSPISFDKIWGSIFVLDNQHLLKYTNLRTAVIKSIWHLGEITKHSDFISLIEK